MEKRNTIRNVLLDWSGTLADDLPPVVDATNGVLQHFGRPPLTQEEFCRQFSLPFADFYARVLPGIPLSDLDPIYTRCFEASQERVEELPGARRFLEHCASAGRRLFLLSSVKEQHFERQAAELGFRDFFERAYTEVWDKRAQIHSILERHSLHPDETIFAGDMIHDVETAQQGGVISVATLTGYDNREELQSANPDYLVDDLSALIDHEWFAHGYPELPARPN